VKTADRALRVPPVDSVLVGITMKDSAHTAAGRPNKAPGVVVVPSLDLRDEVL